MKGLFKMRRLALILIIFISLEGGAFGWSLFKKKYDKEEEMKEPMVQTVDEWMESATSLKMDMRKREEDSSKKDEKLIPPADRPLQIIRYNVKAGSRELDLTHLNETKNVRSIFVADPDFENAVYSEVYYYPQTGQTASTLYLIELDRHLGKKERLADVSIFEHTRYPLISTALPYLREGFFSTLTLVDFSSDGKKILVKEKRGSNKWGLYETYAWLYFITDEPRENNRCYRNNINFSNELSTYDAITEGAASSVGQNKNLTNFDFDNSKNSKNNSMDSNTDFYAGNSSNANSSLKQGNTGNSKTLKSGEYYGSDKIKYDLDNIESAPEKNITSSGENNAVTGLNYSDMNSFILATWKDQEMEPRATSRWYNVAPADFRVDDTYENSTKNIGFGVRLNLLNEMIKAYWFDRQKLILNHIRWDLNPVGFNKNNEDEIIVNAWGYGVSGKEISLGRWAVNINDGLVRLVLEDEDIQIEANGFFVEQRLNP
ncbi:MAG: hypothetical protein LUE64_02085 [Candidatus Gastranaerophilales bacterium]|nr:hypothetical protein [Candidatus Gastranaerophilales bacterium]